MNKLLAGFATLPVAFMSQVHAAAPAWVATSLDTAKTDISDIVGAAAPVVFAICAVITGVYLVMKLFKRGAR